MRVIFGASLLFFASVLLVAQATAPASGPAKAPAHSATPAPAQPAASAPTAVSAQPPQVEDSKVGFSFSLPADWEFVAPAPARKVTEPYPGLATVKKGDACIETVFTARHGSPASVVVVTALPFACYGHTMKASDLGSLGAGAVEGLKRTFSVHDSVQGNYALGGHTVWIERAKGTHKGHEKTPFVYETACTVLARGAVCWMTAAADWNSLHDFEQAPVTLEGERFAALVPVNAFVSSPK
ncbi:MAG: hypothetical protein ACP5E2_12865 [Terracidiphilus sp.]